MTLKLKKILLTAFITASIQVAYSEPIRIMSLGDSISAGFPNGSYNYRLQLAEKLRSISCNVDFVGAFDDTLSTTISSYSAISGITANTVNTIDASHPYSIDYMMEKGKPDIVLMLLGVNDIQLTFSSPDDTINNLHSIIEKIRLHNPSIKIFLGMYPDIRPDLPNMKIMNEMISTLVEGTTEQSPIILVDHSIDFNPTTGADTSDGVHPNINGDSKYANNWFKALVNDEVCNASKIVYNVALNKPVDVSENIYGYGNPYFTVNDLVNDTGWSRAVNDGQDQTLTIDLQGLYNINDIEINYVSTDAYQIEVSTDREEPWKSIVEENNNNKSKMLHQIPPVDARYVRLTLKPPFLGNVMTAKEIRVMGTPVAIP